MKLYHANTKETGTAVSIFKNFGAVVFEVARQIPGETNYSPANGGFVPTFDWGDSQSFRLSVLEASQMLEVLLGCAESVCDGKGFLHKNAASKRGINIRFTHVVEPIPGYRFVGVVKDSSKEENDVREFFFTMTEGFALSIALKSAIKEMFFYD